MPILSTIILCLMPFSEKSDRPSEALVKPKFKTTNGTYFQLGLTELPENCG